MNLRNLGRIFLGWVALVAAQMIAGMILPVKAPIGPHALEWLIVTDFLVAATLGLFATQADTSGWKLAGVLAAVLWSVNIANSIEGAVFLKKSGIPWGGLLGYTCVASALAFVFWRYVFGTHAAGPQHNYRLSTKGGTALWKFAVLDLLFLLLYFGAGTVIWPYVRDFYAKQIMPSGETIIALQLLVRGPIFIGVCLVLARLIDFPRWTSAVAVGIAFAVLNGIAPLLMPNPYFPDAVRWVHLAEVSSSSFVFGAAVRLLWDKRREEKVPTALRQAA